MTSGYGVRDVAFECIVLSRYGDFGKLGSYAFFHTYVIDKERLLTNEHNIKWGICNVKFLQICALQAHESKDFFVWPCPKFEHGGLGPIQTMAKF